MSKMPGQRKKRKTRTTDDDPAEEARLEKLVLGKEHGLSELLEKSVEGTSENDDCSVDDKSQIKSQKKPAWIDEDDAGLEIPAKLRKYVTSKSGDSYQELLRRQYQRNSGHPSWADVSEASRKSDLDDDIDEMMRCGNLLGKSSSLPKDILAFRRVDDLNKETRIEGPFINAVEFHPSATVALIAGNSGIASIVQVNGTTNSKLQTVKFRQFPISCAHFSTNGEEFIVSSKSHRSFFYYDMLDGKSVQVAMHHAIGVFDMSKFRMSPDGKFIAVCGRFGTIHLLSAKTKEWICDLKMNDHVYDLSFSNDGRRMYSYSDTGVIYEWDMDNRCCIRKMFDEGCIKGLSIVLSPSGQILATGTSSGIVNLYEMPLKNNYLTPSKVIKNLVTSITEMCFNSSSEILAIASDDKKNALRLVHFPSMTVFSNFPGNADIGRPRVTSFSPLGGYFAVGTGQQAVLLYSAGGVGIIRRMIRGSYFGNFLIRDPYQLF